MNPGFATPIDPKTVIAAISGERTTIMSTKRPQNIPAEAYEKHGSDLGNELRVFVAISVHSYRLPS